MFGKLEDIQQQQQPVQNLQVNNSAVTVSDRGHNITPSIRGLISKRGITPACRIVGGRELHRKSSVHGMVYLLGMGVEERLT